MLMLALDKLDSCETVEKELKSEVSERHLFTSGILAGIGIHSVVR